VRLYLDFDVAFARNPINPVSRQGGSVRVMVMAGVDLYTVKELMGHSTIQMTERYAHPAPEHSASAVEKISTPVLI
jgi:site-specific recombinase XerC